MIESAPRLVWSPYGNEALCGGGGRRLPAGDGGIGPGSSNWTHKLMGGMGWVSGKGGSMSERDGHDSELDSYLLITSEPKGDAAIAAHAACTVSSMKYRPGLCERSYP